NKPMARPDPLFFLFGIMFIGHGRFLQMKKDSQSELFCHKNVDFATFKKKKYPRISGTFSSLWSSNQ
ncbi:MAG: hypothetical protein IKD13_10630, partial [Firmicutes bacterium]|nr:hypothetical protein [Bacillota bacterium]